MALLIAAAISLPAAGISVAAMRGPTAMGLAGLMDKAAAGPVDGNSYSFTLEGSPDAVVPLIVRGDADIAAIPANLASVLYNRTEGGVVALAVNTLGVLYIVENGDTVHSVDDLRGRTIYSAGKGATPEYSLLYILSQSGLEPGKDVYTEWKSEHAECVAALASDPDGVAMLPQPFVNRRAFFRGFLEAECERRDHFNVVLLGKKLHGRSRELHAAPARSIRLRKNERNVVTGFNEALKRDSRKIRRTGKDNLHAFVRLGRRSVRCHSLLMGWINGERDRIGARCAASFSFGDSSPARRLIVMALV